jgi:hypothetical protein
MGTDYAEKERTFIAELEADTGRGLGAWLAAISQTGLTSRNDIIDWLRQGGFTFSNASWIERIHHNGGRLVYSDDSARPPEMPPPIPPAMASRVKPEKAASVTVDQPIAEAKATQVANIPAVLEPNDALSNVLSTAKGLRPLAELVLREVRVAVPSAKFEAADPFVKVSAPKPFAALLMGPKRLLLYSDFGGAGSNGIKAGAAVAKGPPPYPNMLVLDDARKIDQAFRDVVAAAATRANG